MATIWCLTDERYLAQRMPGAAIEWLRERGHEVRVVVADRAVVRTGGCGPSSALEDLDDGDVVVSRSRHPLALALLDAAGRRRAHVVTPWSGVVAVRNKARCADLLALHGIRTPETFIVADREALTALEPSCYPLVVKPYLGDNGRGVTLLESPGHTPALDGADGLLLAQRWVDTGGWDVKVYVCGERVWAVRRPSPLRPPPGEPVGAQPLPVTPELGWIARTCRDAFDLPLCGVDVVMGPRGALVVDVNDFPNYTGVEQAPQAVGELVAARLGRPRSIPLVGGRACAS